MRMKMALAIAVFFGIASVADAVVECLMLDAGSAVYASATTDASATTNLAPSERRMASCPFTRAVAYPPSPAVPWPSLSGT
jgi:hypothetical protein